MSLYWVALLAVALFTAAYFTYGKFLTRHFGLNETRKTPACEINDGVDFVPARKRFLLGQHFSAIAAAGPIVGPILAGLWFGWLPVLLWIVGGSIFLGAVHDFASLAGSVRHRATSIVEMVRQHLGPRGHLFFMMFVWLSLMYVITAFTDLTSSSFVSPELGGSVASSSFLYLFIGVVMGIALYRFRMPLWAATLTFLPLVILAIWGGQYFPLVLPSGVFGEPQKAWNVILLAYCFAASLVPMWLLLQPRGYLGGFFLYGTLAMGVVGVFLGGEKIQYPAFTGFVNSANGFSLFPLLFVTVACGACSGFHGIVCSGTTSKQISKEPDCHLVGYGGMLMEGLVAVIALSTVMVLTKTDAFTAASPDRIYAEGLSRFVSHFGIPIGFARSFALLAFTTFIYDTLDVATRLARYIFEELTGWKGTLGKVAATAASLALPLFCVSLKVADVQGNLIPAWKIFWTIFGTSNQLLAGLTLMVLSIWLKKSGKSWWVSLLPSFFMLAMTLWSLLILMKPLVFGFLAKDFKWDPTAAVSGVLFLLAVLLVREGIRTIFSKRTLEPNRVKG
ncbi:MAG: carbon starvation protein A [Candidatus Omnitrophica bacterium]|nr:carbon starvation protein A [Candidatus Omnitrophota bacterium]